MVMAVVLTFVGCARDLDRNRKLNQKRLGPPVIKIVAPHRPLRSQLRGEVQRRVYFPHEDVESRQHRPRVENWPAGSPVPPMRTV